MNRYGHGSGPKSKFKSYKAHEYVISAGIDDKVKPALLWVNVKDNMTKDHWKMEFDLSMFPNKGFKKIEDPYNILQKAIKLTLAGTKKYNIVPYSNACVVQLIDNDLMFTLFPIQTFNQYKQMKQQNPNQFKMNNNNNNNYGGNQMNQQQQPQQQYQGNQMNQMNQYQGSQMSMGYNKPMPNQMGQQMNNQMGNQMRNPMGNQPQNYNSQYSMNNANDSDYDGNNNNNDDDDDSDDSPPPPRQQNQGQPPQGQPPQNQRIGVNMYQAKGYDQQQLQNKPFPEDSSDDDDNNTNNNYGNNKNNNQMFQQQPPSQASMNTDEEKQSQLYNSQLNGMNNQFSNMNMNNQPQQQQQMQMGGSNYGNFPQQNAMQQMQMGGSFIGMNNQGMQMNNQQPQQQPQQQRIQMNIYGSQQSLWDDPNKNNYGYGNPNNNTGKSNWKNIKNQYQSPSFAQNNQQKIMNNNNDESSDDETNYDYE